MPSPARPVRPTARTSDSSRSKSKAARARALSVELWDANYYTSARAFELWAAIIETEGEAA